jgi:Ti type entry exclusion protein TrbK
MVRRSIAIAALCLAFCGGASVAWLWQTRLAAPTAPVVVSAGCSNDKRLQDFFGGPQKFDMTHGQEMKPRW